MGRCIQHTLLGRTKRKIDRNNFHQYLQYPALEPWRKIQGARLSGNCGLKKTKTMIEVIEATVHDLPVVRQMADQTFYATYLPLQPKEKVEYLYSMMYSASSLAQQIENGQQF